MSRMRKAAMALGALTALAMVGVVGLVGYAATAAERKTMFPDAPAPNLSATDDPEAIARGRYLVHGPAHCSQCHSSDDRKRPELVATTPLRGGLAFEMGPIGATYARNITPDEETGIGRLTDAQLARAIRTGVMHDGTLSIFMRFSAAQLSDEDLVAVISYLRSVEPVRNEVPRGGWTLFGKVLITFAFPELQPRPITGPEHVPPSEEPSVERGRYLAEHVALCTACHTEMDQATFEPSGPKAGGSLPEPSHGDDSDMEFVAPNLTSHPTGITGRMDEDAFVARLRGGRAIASSIMPWEGIQATSESDLRSIYRYLKSLPPVDADRGPSYRKIGWTPEG